MISDSPSEEHFTPSLGGGGPENGRVTFGKKVSTSAIKDMIVEVAANDEEEEHLPQPVYFNAYA